MTKRYRTPKGKSEQIIIIERDGKKIRVMNWHGFYVQLGAHKGPFFFNEIENRRNKNQSIIIVITGAPGEGKTYCGIRLAEVFDKHFDPELQIVFTRPELLHVIGEKSPLKRGQVIIIDEAHYSAGSRRWMEQSQKDLMDSLASVRSRGYIIMIVSLHIEMLDIIIRKYVLSYMLHMESRGNCIVYRLYTPRFSKELYKRRRGKMSIDLPDTEHCAHDDCLSCEWLPKGCLTTRAVYERKKKRFVDDASKQAEARALDRTVKEKTVSDKDRVEKGLEFYKEIVTFKKNRKGKWKGKVDIMAIDLVIERELGVTTGIVKLRLLARRIVLKNPKILTKPQK